MEDNTIDERVDHVAISGDRIEENNSNEREAGKEEEEKLAQEPKVDLKETINRSRNVREKVQTWMTGLVSEVKRKSPSMVHRWVSGERAEADETGKERGREGEGGDRGSKSGAGDGTPIKLEKIEEQVEFSSAGLRSTIKAKLHLHELYDKISKTRDITGLFQRTKTMDQQQQKNDERVQAKEKAVGEDNLHHSMEEVTKDAPKEFYSDEEEDQDQEARKRIELAQSEIEGINYKMLGKASSPKHSHDGECQFSFEDFSFIEARKTPGRDLIAIAATVLEESQETPVDADSGCVDDNACKEETRPEIPAIKPRRLNIGEIGRSASANQHPDSGIDLGTMGNVKRQLLSDIGRRFSEMNESSDCEFRSESLRQDGSSRSLNQFRPNSMPVSPKPRMILSAQHRGSTDFTGSGKQRGSSLLREYSTQSDSSRCSSVESLLESRKPDAETILINLGFGPVQSDDVLSRLPKRFLKPSQVSGIDTEDFLKQQQIATSLHEHSVLGYRGLVGHPHYPPSLIVAKIMERFQVNESHRFLRAADNGRPASAPPSPSAHA